MKGRGRGRAKPSFAPLLRRRRISASSAAAGATPTPAGAPPPASAAPPSAPASSTTGPTSRPPSAKSTATSPPAPSRCSSRPPSPPPRTSPPFFNSVISVRSQQVGAPHAGHSPRLADLRRRLALARSDRVLQRPLKSRSFGENNTMDEYALQSYLHFIGGDDDAVDALDREFVEKLEQERNNLAENVKNLEKNAAEVEARVEKLRTGPSERELREQEKSVLEEDVKKFNTIIGEITGRIPALEKELEKKKEELRAKEEEEGRIREENEELKKTVQLQTFNSRDAERMKKELQAVEGEIADAEIERNKYEKCWDLDRALALKFKELEELAKECNKAVRKLKLGSDYQYVLNAKGSTPAEVMGIDYKSTLKPALDLHANDINKSSVEKLEELIILQQQSKETAARIEEKRNRVVQLHSRVDDVKSIY